jgi:hypothetical protein
LFIFYIVNLTYFTFYYTHFVPLRHLLLRYPEKGFVAECSTCSQLGNGTACSEEQKVPSQSEPIPGIAVRDVEAVLLRAARDVHYPEIGFQLAGAVQKWMRHSNAPASLDFVEKFVNALLKVGNSRIDC